MTMALDILNLSNKLQLKSIGHWCILGILLLLEPLDAHITLEEFT